MTYEFSQYSKKITYNNKVVLGNTKTGQWIRISQEVFNILDSSIENKISLEELKLNLYDDEDKNYIENLYKKLIFMGILDDGKNKPEFTNKIASVEMTHKCNLNCIHCGIDADSMKNSTKEDLTTSELKDILDKLILWNPERIMLSGGEPMIRNDFIELLKYLKDHYKGKIIISTNGTLINNENVEILAECASQIDISLDGYDEKTCSIIRGKGIFNKVIESVKLLQKNGFHQISLSIVTGDKNEYIEEKFRELSDKLKTKAIIRRFMSIGRGKDSKEIFLTTNDSEFKIPDTFLKRESRRPIKFFSCAAAKREVFITYNGDIYPCPSFMKSEYRLGNLNEIKTLEDITNKYDNSKLYNISQSNCMNCEVSLFCWSCMSEFKRIIRSERVFEKRCKKIRPILFEEIWGEKVCCDS